MVRDSNNNIEGFERLLKKMVVTKTRDGTGVQTH